MSADASPRPPPARAAGLCAGHARARVAPRRGAAARRLRSGARSTAWTTASRPSPRSRRDSGSSRRTGAISSRRSATAPPGGWACTYGPIRCRAVRRADPLPKARGRHRRAGGRRQPRLRSHAQHRLAEPPAPPRRAVRDAEAHRTPRPSPASMLLLVTAPYLWRRRQSALRLGARAPARADRARPAEGPRRRGRRRAAPAPRSCSGWGRHSFCVRHDPDTLRTALRRVPLLAGCQPLLCGLAVWIAAPESAGLVDDRARDRRRARSGRSGRSTSDDELGHLDEAIGVTGLLTLVWCAYLLFRPLAAPRVLPGIELRRAARELVRRHGDDTLAYFKLRRDQHYLFSS